VSGLIGSAWFLNNIERVEGEERLWIVEKVEVKVR
jgi:hypothetical protein